MSNTHQSRQVTDYASSEEKRAIALHSERCGGCFKFKFKTDLRPSFVEGVETNLGRVNLCTYCRGKNEDAIFAQSGELFGLSIEIVKSLNECFKSSKRLSDISNGRKAHTLCLDDLLRLWIIQDGKCSLSGIELDPKGDDFCHPSIDRIDSRDSYRMGNVQLVTRAINYMKGPLPQGEFLALCRAVSRFKKKIAN